MAIPPIFKFKNIRVKLNTTSPTLVYGMVENNSTPNTLDPDILPADVSSVILTVQVSNLTNANVPVSAYVYNSDVVPAPGDFPASTTPMLVKNYPLLPKNAFDPLSGNLVLSAGDQLWMQAGIADACDVVVSLLEIANATAS